MKIYYIANARMPNEKAHGIQIAKMCEAFVENRIELVLIVPNRPHTESIKNFYSLRCEVQTIRISTLPLYVLGPVGFALSSTIFTMRALLLLYYKRLRGEKFYIYTVDMDTFSYALLPLVGNTFAEMHTPKKSSPLQRFFFHSARGIIATNTLIKNKISTDFSLPDQKVFVAPNGVDLSQFTTTKSKVAARERLGLSQDKPIALYVGKFYTWKGLEILATASALKPHINWVVVGGEKEEFLTVTKVTEVPTNLIFMGGRPMQEVPHWLLAADTLLQLGTEKNEDSNKYTSPMKLFEYMASGTPIVASSTPANKEILSEQEALWYEPDYAQSLAKIVEEAIADTSGERSQKAREHAESYSWNSRAEKILAFINRADTLV